MKKRFLLFVSFSILFLCAYKPLKKIDFLGVQYLRNYDGDTVTVNIFDVHPLLGREIGVRIKDIDTPEINDKQPEAVAAKIFLEEILEKSKRIDLIGCTRGKYFRIVCDIIVDGQSMSELIVRMGHSKPKPAGVRK